MKLHTRTRPISYLKAHAAEIMRELGAEGQPLVITQHGQAKAVLQDIDSFEQTQEALALLKMLALGNRQIEEGRVQPAAEVMQRLRERQQSR
jgi:prevent-host-death family protein